MISHIPQWPDTPMLNVRIIENGGAWFVWYHNAESNRLQLQKRNGRPKGFRSLDALVNLLRGAFDIQLFEVHGELPKPHIGRVRKWN